MNSSDEDLDKLEAALSACVRITKRPGYWEEYQRRAKVSLDRPAAMIVLCLSEGPSQFQNLVNRLGIEAPSVSRKVHELENQGLVVRRPHSDKRVHELGLSPKGRDIATRLRQAKRSILSEVLTSWTASDRRQLVDLLSVLASDMANCFKQKSGIQGDDK